MLYVFSGPDTETSREKLNALLEGLLQKKPHASHFKIDSDTFDPAQLQEYIQGQGLFENQYIVVLDHVFDRKDAQEVVLDKIEDMSSSDNVFLLLETDLKTSQLKKIKGVAQKVQEFSFASDKKGISDRFNLFSLTDAVGAKDRKKIWLLYTQARQSGVSPEEIHGVLWWQVKTLLLVASKKTKGLKPFVINKTEKFLQHYEIDELKMLSGKLTHLYHESRHGQGDIDVLLERFLLKL